MKILQDIFQNISL